MDMSAVNSALTAWYLNSIVLCHINRFFQAATSVVRDWRDSDRDLLGALLTLSGNMLWARSSFEATSREQERSMAYTGAMVSSVADRAVSGAGNIKQQQALAVLASAEHEIHEIYDTLLAMVMKELQTAGLAHASPGRVNAAVWSLLFPAYPYACSQGELAEAIRERLLAA